MKTLQAMYHLFFFKPYTTMPRWMEIAYGFFVWAMTTVIAFNVWVLIKYS